MIIFHIFLLHLVLFSSFPLEIQLTRIPTTLILGYPQTHEHAVGTLRDPVVTASSASAPAASSNPQQEQKPKGPGALPCPSQPQAEPEGQPLSFSLPPLTLPSLPSLPYPLSQSRSLSMADVPALPPGGRRRPAFGLRPSSGRPQVRPAPRPAAGRQEDLRCPPVVPPPGMSELPGPAGRRHLGAAGGSGPRSAPAPGAPAVACRRREGESGWGCPGRREGG